MAVNKKVTHPANLLFAEKKREIIEPATSVTMAKINICIGDSIINILSPFYIK